MALRGTLQKATFEAAYFERQALSAQRFLAFDNVLGESQDMHAFPPDTLTERLAEVSQEPVGSPLRSDPSPRHHVCEIDSVPSVSPLTPPQPQSGASSRQLTHGGNQPAVDSASAPRPKRSVRIAGSPAVTPPRRHGGALWLSSPCLPSQPVRPQRRQTAAVQPKKAKVKVRVKATRKR